MSDPRAARGSILVVDDYEPFCEMLQTALELAGYTAVTATTGHAALATAAACGGVDVALVDLGLPDRPGLEVAHELAVRGLARRCLLMSGLQPDEEPAWPSGWTSERRVLLKPYTMSELLREIDAALADTRSERSHAAGADRDG